MTWPSLLNKRVLGVDPYSEETGHAFLKVGGGLFAGSTPGEHLEGKAKADAEKATKLAGEKAAADAANTGRVKSATERIMAHANEGSEGFTEHMLTGEVPQKGFQCAVPGHDLVKPVDELTSSDVDKWMAQNKEVLSKPNVYMGGWVQHKDGVAELVIEPSENIPKREDAFKAGVARNQIEIYDNTTKKCISTGGSGAHNRLKPKPKTVTLFHGTRPENVAGLKENGLTAPPEVMSSKWPQLTDNFDEAHKYAGPGGSVAEFQVPQKEIWSDDGDPDDARLWAGQTGKANLVRGDPEGTSVNYGVKTTLPGSYISNVYADGERPANPADLTTGQKQAIAYHQLLQNAYASKYSNNNSWLGKQPSAKLDAANKKRQTLENTYKMSTGDDRKLIAAKLRELEEGEDHPIIKQELHEHTAKLTALPKLGEAPLDTSRIKAGLAKDMPLTNKDVEAKFQGFIDYAKKQGKLGVWKNWYHNAHDQIHARAKALDFDHEKFFAMVSATSPRMRWEENGRLKNMDAAEKAVHIGRYYEGSNLSIDEIAKKEVPDDIGAPEKTPLMRTNLKNALRIYYGEHPDSVLRAAKTRSFYNNLRFPGETRDATMDTWMGNAMVGHTPSDKEVHALFGNSMPDQASFKRYGWSADRIRAVADKNGLKPDEAQAVVWMAVGDKDKDKVVKPPTYLDGNPDDAYFASPPTTNVKFPTMHPPVMKTTQMPLREGPPGTNLRPLKTTAQGKWKLNKYAVSTKDGEEIGMRFDGDLPKDEQPTKEQAQQVLSTVADLHEKYPLKMTPRVRVVSFKRMSKEIPDGGSPFAWVHTDSPNAINIQGHAMRNNFDRVGADFGKIGKSSVAAPIRPGWFMPVFDNLTDEHDFLASLPALDSEVPEATSESTISKSQYVTAHEFGHCLEFNGKNAWGSTAKTEENNQRQVAAKLEGAFRLVQTNQDKWNEMSDYGRSNAYEAGAEAFAEYALTDGTTTNGVAQSYARAGKFAKKVTGK